MADEQLNQRTVFESGSWRLTVETVALANGRLRERGKVDHPGAVVLVPLLEQDGQQMVLLLRQYRHALDETIWELPAGTRGWEEPWLPCAQRELREETGYRADNLSELGKLWPAPGVSNELMTIYLATGLTPDPLPADEDEQIEVRPVLLAEAIRMAREGEIWDAKTVAGLWKTAVWLNAA